jgi:dienelactone hydrolase
VLRKTLIIFLFSFVATLGFAQATRNIHLTTTDGVGIAGTYYPTDQPHAPVVLMLHSVFRDHTVWADFATLLQRNGIAALAIDMRGHGESTHQATPDGLVKIDPRELTSRDYQNMQLDVEAAIDWLEAQPEIDTKHIGLIGESVGANVALRYAAINEDLGAVVVFSPGLNYRGVRTDDVITNNCCEHIPLHIFVSQYDAFAFESSKHLIELRTESGIPDAAKEMTVCSGSLHGSEMLKGVRNLPQIVLAWLKNAFLGTPDAPASTPPPVAAPTPAK